MMKAVLLSLAVIASPAISADDAKAQTAWDEVAAALGTAGKEMPGGVYRVGLPRTDLHVILDGTEIKPALALGSWLAFKSMGPEPW
jgi:hypothetical protein